MNPLTAVIPLSEPLPLPAPAWLLWALLMLTLLLHVLAMNVLVGGSVLAAYVRIREGASARARELLTRLSQPLPVVVAATVTLGVAPLLFLQVLYGRLFFVSSILMAWVWLAIVPALIGVYYATYFIAGRAKRGLVASPWLYGAVAVVLLGIGFLYTNNMALMLRADRFAALYDASGRGLHLNLSDPTLWPRWLHMMLGAVGVGGLGLVLFGFLPSNASSDAGRLARRIGAQASAGATALNVLVGLWFVTRLPSGTLERFLGGDVFATTILVTGVVLAFGTVVMLVLLARADASARLALGGAGGLLLTVIAMLFVRDQVRTAGLDRVGFAETTWVVPQWDVFALFVLFLVAALTTVGWMGWAFFRECPERKRVATAA